MIIKRDVGRKKGGKQMKTILGLVLIVLGVLLGFYVGAYLMFFKGIVQIVQNITPQVNAVGISLGALRIVFATLLGWVCAIILILPGVKLID